jgi:hypothetical protein
LIKHPDKSKEYCYSLIKSANSKRKIIATISEVEEREEKLLQHWLLRIGVHFIKHDIQCVFLKCAEILPTRL